jgi:hypothetical protein
MGFEEEHPQGVTDPLSGPPTTAVSMAYMPLSFLACPIRHLV